jgi:hypothetical protein
VAPPVYDFANTRAIRAYHNAGFSTGCKTLDWEAQRMLLILRMALQGPK